MLNSRQPRILQQIEHSWSGDGLSDYSKALFLKSANKPGQFVADDGAEVAFAGRSNAGKSSAINRILARRGLARTSKTPGRTQLINFFALGEGRRLVDLPGYGFARVSRNVQDHWRDLLNSYFSTRKSLNGVFVITDVRRGLLDYDRQMIDWAAEFDCTIHILLTKADKLSRGKASATLLDVRRQLGSTATAQLFSALDGNGVIEAREHMEQMLGGREVR
jgi:GTP-binding protein